MGGSRKIINTDFFGQLLIPQSFCGAVNLDKFSPALITLEDGKIVVQPAPENEIKWGMRCVKCGHPKVIDDKVPLCEICLNQYLTEIIKEKNKNK